MGVFVLLLLSGERNFGVRLNKPYTAAVPMDISVFSGSHADLLIIVFHKVSFIHPVDTELIQNVHFLDHHHWSPEAAAPV